MNDADMVLVEHSRLEAVYGYIVRFKKLHDGNSPSIRQISRGLNIPSTSTVFYYLNQLEKQGLIRRELGESRNICIVGGKWHLEVQHART